MPEFEFTSPEGKTYVVSGPEGATREQAFGILQQRIQAGTAQPQTAEPSAPAEGERAPLSWGEVATSAITSAPKSALEFGKAVVQPIIYPIETAKSFAKVGAGVLEKFGMKEAAGNEQYADAVGRFFTERYGGMENIKRTLATDPVGALADLSTVLTLGGGAAVRAPAAAGQVARTVQTAGRAIDPLRLAGQAVGAGYRKFAAPPIGLTSGVGAEALRSAERAGAEGGPAAQAFRESVTGQAPMEAVVAEARGAVDQLYRERGDLYRQSMQAIKADVTPLSWDKVDDALADVTKVKVHKGLIVDEATQDIRSRIGQKVAEWKMALGPNPTMEDLDALKQTLRNLKDVEPHTPEAKVLRDATNAISKTITEHNPKYGNIMEGYGKASDQIDEIERTLSLNPNASIDTALRKLQSVLRDNVNTNFGQRRQLADFLVRHGAPHLMERLAGQALQPAMPRGLSRFLAAEIGTKVAALSGGAAAAGAGAAGLGGAAAAGGAMLPLMSPRLMGELAYGIGRARGVAESKKATGLGYQAGRLSRQLDPRAILQNEAAAALKDEEGEYSEADRKALQQASSPNATSDVMLRAKAVLERGAAKREPGASSVLRKGGFGADFLGNIVSPPSIGTYLNTLAQATTGDLLFPGKRHAQYGRLPFRGGGASGEYPMAPAPGESSYQGPQ